MSEKWSLYLHHFHGWESFLMRRAYFSLYSLTPTAQNKTTILQIYRYYNVLILRPATLLTTTGRLK